MRPDPSDIAARRMRNARPWSSSSAQPLKPGHGKKVMLAILVLIMIISLIFVIQNRDDQITTIYDFGGIVNEEQKRDFLEFANQWWWESNRSIPINIFLKHDWDQFKPYLKTFINKDLTIILGPTTSLQELSRKKIKRRSITLVRRVD